MRKLLIAFNVLSQVAYHLSIIPSVFTCIAEAFFKSMKSRLPRACTISINVVGLMQRSAQNVSDVYETQPVPGTL